jgi:penicillin-binding protein 1A
MSTHARSRRRRHRRRGPGPALLFIGVVSALAAIAGLTGVGYVISLASDAPSLDGRKAKDNGQTSVVYAADGQRLGYIQTDVLRFEIPRREVPRTVRAATVAIEDERFWKHDGVDAEGVARAAVKNVESGRTVEGGSTITMQLARALYLNNERSFKRKVQEARIARDLEDRRSKHWILHEYVNNAPYGTNGGQEAVGIQAAARTYFNKPASKLKLHEAAMLAGLPQAPSEYNPFREPDKARARRNDVLAKMAENDMIAPRTARRAMRRPLGVERNQFYTQRREQFFFDYVRKQLIDRYGSERVRRGGLRVDTTIDLDKQQAARAAIASQLTFAGAPRSAVVSIDPRTGHILAMASSANYGDSKFNLAAQGKRRAGSTFKTFGLVAALRQGVSPEGTSYASKRLKFNDPKYGPIDVDCYAGCSGKRMNLVQATLASDNAVYQQLGLDIGPEAVRDTAKDMGITSPMEAVPAEILGGLKYGVSPLEMTRAYATLASGGTRTRPIAITRVRFPDGRVDDNWNKPRKKRVLDRGVATKVTSILRQNVQRGTGGSAQIGCPTAGKTGTVDEFKDAWFAGYTPNMATTVWVGFPGEERSMVPPATPMQVNGGSYPASIWGAYMRQARRGCPDFKGGGTFASRPFFGRYAQSGAPGDGEDDETSGVPGAPGAPAPAPTAPGPTADAGADDDDGASGGGGRGGGGGGATAATYDEDLYDTPPQAAPATAPTGAAQPTADSTGGAAAGE